jgi:RNA polymerase sigma-70 factor (ECF subfamily)
MTALDGKALLDHGNAIAKRYAGRVGPDVAEELRAEAVLRALGSPPPDGRMQPWLERIYRNLFVDLWRRGKLLTVDIADLPELAGAGTPEEEVLHRERRRMVRESLHRLPREARRALLSRYYGELDDEVAASRLGIATATVRTRIHRALARLRTRLGDLRAFCPPILGKLGAQAAGVGLAPVMVAALVVVGSSSRAPVSEPALHPASAVARQAAPGWAVRPTPAKVPAVSAAPLSRSRAAKKTAMVVPAAEPAPLPMPARFIDLGESDPVVGDILRPDGIDIFAEPPQPATPCMVEAPSNFVAQIEKMIEDRL